MIPGPSDHPAGTGDPQPPAVPALAAAVRGLEWLVRIAIVIAMAMVLIFTVGQVTDRYIVKSSFDAHDQFARIGMVWLTFLGIAVGIRHRINVRIELLSHFASPALRRHVATVLDLVTLVVSVLLVVVGAQLLEIGAFQAIMGTSLNYDTMYGALLVGMSLLALFMVLRFADRFSGGRLKIDPPVADDDYRD